MNKIHIFIGIAFIVIGGYFLWPTTKKIKTDGAPLVEVKVPTLSEKALIGQTTFNENCVACHGNNAVGIDGAGPPLIHIIYEPSHHGDQAFYLAAKIGVRSHHWPFGNMPPVDDITDQEITDITFYIRELQRANGIK